MTTPESPTDGAVSRTVGRDLADRMTALYADAERRLAADIARRLAAGMDRPDWADQKLMALGDLRRFTRTLTQRLAAETEHEITQALLLGYVRGGTEAMRTITRLQNTLPEWLQRGGIDPGPRILAALAGKQSQLSAKLAEIGRAFPGVANVMRMVGSLALRIAGTHLPILRWAEDAYREVIATTAVPGVLLGLDTRRRASQIAWERLLTQGITGFKDKSGRNWNLASYVEMATRSGVAQASVEGHLDRLTDAGIDLVIVSNAPQECKRCRPWEGKILARSGPDGRRTIAVENVVTGELETVEIWGTVDEAIRAGLLHPNCRHSLNGYLHGATKVPTNTQDPEGDAARQQLRALEREVRREKIKATATIDPHAADRHERRVRDLQAQIRDHVDATKHLGIFRKPERERVNLGNAPDPKRKAPQSPRVVKTVPKPKPQTTTAEPKKAEPAKPVEVSPVQQPAVLSREQLASIYGPRLNVKGSGDQIDKHLGHLGKIPEPVHRLVAQHFRQGASQADAPGIYIGPGAVPELSRQAAYLKGVRPRGWAEGKTWDIVPGAYMPAERQLLIGDENTHGHGSTSLATHEFGHALDHAAGYPSRTAEWKRAIEALHASPSVRVSPYYTVTGNPSGWGSESFAEAFGAWSLGAVGPNAMIMKILDALASPRWDYTLGLKERVDALGPDVVNAARSMIAIFESLGR